MKYECIKHLEVNFCLLKIINFSWKFACAVDSFSLRSHRAKSSLLEDLLRLESIFASDTCSTSHLVVLSLGLAPSHNRWCRHQVWRLLRLLWLVTSHRASVNPSLHLFEGFEQLATQIGSVLAPTRSQLTCEGLIGANVVRSCSAFQDLLEPRDADAKSFVEVVSILKLRQVEELRRDLARVALLRVRTAGGTDFEDWLAEKELLLASEELHLAEEHLTVVRVDKDLKDVLQDMRNHLAWRVVLLAQLWVRMIQLGMHRLARVLAKLTGKIGELAVDWIRMLRYQVQIRLFAEFKDSMQLWVFAVVLLAEVLLDLGNGGLEDVSSRFIVFTLLANWQEQLLDLATKNTRRENIEVCEADEGFLRSLGFGDEGASILAVRLHLCLRLYAEELSERALHSL